jgi:hypothetical protein
MTNTTQDRRERADAADYAAGLCWRRGEYGASADLIGQARELDPERGDLWDQRLDTIGRAISGTQAHTEATGGEGTHSHGRGPGNDLERQLAAAGIAPDDPAMEHWRSWNALCYRLRDGDLEAGR